MPAIGADCRKAALGLLLPLAAAAAYADSGTVYNPATQSFYRRIDTHMWWPAAAAHCQALGGHLATITGAEENQFVFDHLVATSDADAHWLGATDRLQEGSWRWTTGEAWTHSGWGPGEPNSCGGDEDYLWMWSNGLWNDNAEDASNCNGPADAFVVSALCEWDRRDEPLDLGSWTAESYPPLFNHPFPADWQLAPDRRSVFQEWNSPPAFFYSDFDAIGAAVEVTIEVQNLGDDDYIGIALGFRPGDTTNPNADYLLVDWKQADQWYDWGQILSCPAGSHLASAGLAVSRVTGVPTVDELWAHFNHPCSGAGNGVEELQRGATLGATGWRDRQRHTFRFEFTATSLTVHVDGGEELAVAGSFRDGRLAFYGLSQEDVVYAAWRPMSPGNWVRWDPAVGGNGHYYAAVAVPGGIDWDGAAAAASARGGHLATVTSAEENAFIYSLVDSPEFWSQLPSSTTRSSVAASESGYLTFGPWLGGLQPPGSPEPGGGWQWVTGEAFSYSNWHLGQPNEADQSGENQDRIHMVSFGHPTRVGAFAEVEAARGRVDGRGFWNDLAGGAWAIPGYVIEASGPGDPYFFDDFDGSDLDPGRWTASLGPPRFYCDADCSTGYWTTPTGSPSYGSISVSDSWVVLDNDRSTVFPFVESSYNPFPPSGDFRLDARMKYDRVTTHGSGFYALLRDSENPLWPLSNRVFRIWADNDGDYVFLFDQVWLRSPRDTSEHLYSLIYSGGAYTALVDGVAVLGPVTSTVRPNQLAFGNVGWAWWFPALWSTFRLDSVGVTVQGPGNSPPVARCRDVELSAGEESCPVEASIDDGSYDPDGDDFALTQEPPGPFPLGTSEVTLRVSDGELEESCRATVTVVDRSAPAVWCNAPRTITPSLAPVSFTPVAADNCGGATPVVHDSRCSGMNAHGGPIRPPCQVATDGTTITILDSGGVGTSIRWKVFARDDDANRTDVVCEVQVVRPGLSRCESADLNLAGWAVGWQQEFSAPRSITASDFHIVGPGGDVVFTAGETIVLEHGFSVGDSREFAARILPQLEVEAIAEVCLQLGD